MLCPIITPDFETKRHDIMTLPLQRFDILLPFLLRVCCCFDVTLQRWSVPSADFDQCDTSSSLLTSILMGWIDSAGAFEFPAHLGSSIRRFCNWTLMALLVPSTLSVSAFLSQRIHCLWPAFRSQYFTLFVSLYALYVYRCNDITAYNDFI